ncbi:hypothetical protein BE20_26950 [Sorangium cellulosum]|nr:hypothetical protein BE20_26950 [Sorangium cellulosum]
MQGADQAEDGEDGHALGAARGQERRPDAQEHADADLHLGEQDGDAERPALEQHGQPAVERHGGGDPDEREERRLPRLGTPARAISSMSNGRAAPRRAASAAIAPIARASGAVPPSRKMRQVRRRSGSRAPPFLAIRRSIGTSAAIHAAASTARSSAQKTPRMALPVASSAVAAGRSTAARGPAATRASRTKPSSGSRAMV